MSLREGMDDLEPEIPEISTKEAIASQEAGMPTKWRSSLLAGPLESLSWMQMSSLEEALDDASQM